MNSTESLLTKSRNLAKGLTRVFLVIVACLPMLALGSTNLRVVSWNINRTVGSNNPSTAQQPSLAKIINYLNPDIWVINELGGNSSGYNSAAEQAALVSFINANVTIYGANPQAGVNYYVYVGTQSDNFISNAIVSKYPILSTSVRNDSLRGFYASNINVNGQTVGVFFTHLKAGSTASDGLSRQTEADGDSAYVNTWKSANPGKPFFMCGDWNESEDPNNTPNYGPIGTTLSNGEAYHPITTMKSPGVSDPKPASVKNDTDTESSRTSSPNIRFDYNLYSGATYLSGFLFDTKQYTSAQLSALNSANGTNFVSTDSSSASDHLPVVCDYQIGSPATITGHVDLGEFGGAVSGTPLTLKVLQNGNVLDTVNATLDANGNFSVQTTRVGTYDVQVKASHWLSSTQTSVTFTGSGASGLAYSLTNGDIDGDNVVGPSDLNLLRSNFGSSGPTGDLDGDGVVGPSDLNILRNHFGQSGS